MSKSQGGNEMQPCPLRNVAKFLSVATRKERRSRCQASYVISIERLYAQYSEGTTAGLLVLTAGLTCLRRFNHPPTLAMMGLFYKCMPRRSELPPCNSAFITPPSHFKLGERSTFARAEGWATHYFKRSLAVHALVYCNMHWCKCSSHQARLPLAF